MAKNFLPALGLVSAIALSPATTAGIAQVDVGTVREISQFMTVFDRVKAEYVDRVDDATLIRGAIDGMLASLDPHSSYLDARSYQSLMNTTDGNYGGLGLTVTMDDGAVKVIAATRGTPADRAGIKAGDYITHIDGPPLLRRHARRGGRPDARPAPAQRPHHRGPSRPRPAVRRHHHPRDHRHSSGPCEVRDGVGILTVTHLQPGHYRRHPARHGRYRAPARHPPLGYILDLRSNPGGLLDQAVGLSDLFSSVARSSRSAAAGRPTSSAITPKPGDAAHGLPLIVLVDAGTASASEIVAGALQDHRRAIVMGERSFARARSRPCCPWATAPPRLRLTTARYYTPSGRSVQEGCIAPDIRVPQLPTPTIARVPTCANRTSGAT